MHLIRWYGSMIKKTFGHAGLDVQLCQSKHRRPLQLQTLSTLSDSLCCCHTPHTLFNQHNCITNILHFLCTCQMANGKERDISENSTQWLNHESQYCCSCNCIWPIICKGFPLEYEISGLMYISSTISDWSPRASGFLLIKGDVCETKTSALHWPGTETTHSPVQNILARHCPKLMYFHRSSYWLQWFRHQSADFLDVLSINVEHLQSRHTDI